MARLQAINSPFVQEWFRENVVQRWVQQGKAFLIPGTHTFRFETQHETRRRIERIEQERYHLVVDDRITRRWLTRPSAGVETMQLKPVAQVGTGSGTTRNPDKLTRRTRLQKPRSIPVS